MDRNEPQWYILWNAYEPWCLLIFPLALWAAFYSFLFFQRNLNSIINTSLFRTASLGRVRGLGITLINHPSRLRRFWPLNSLISSSLQWPLSDLFPEAPLGRLESEWKQSGPKSLSFQSKSQIAADISQPFWFPQWDQDSPCAGLPLLSRHFSQTPNLAWIPQVNSNH